MKKFLIKNISRGFTQMSADKTKKKKIISHRRTQMNTDEDERPKQNVDRPDRHWGVIPWRVKSKFEHEFMIAYSVKYLVPEGTESNHRLGRSMICFYAFVCVNL